LMKGAKVSKRLEAVEELSKLWYKTAKLWVYTYLWVEAVSTAFDLWSFVAKTVWFTEGENKWHTIWDYDDID
jgi:hypothetical protein